MGVLQHAQDWGIPTYEERLADYDRRLANLDAERAARRREEEGKQAHLGWFDRLLAPPIETAREKNNYESMRNGILNERAIHMRTRQDELAQQVADEYNRLYGGRATADEVNRGVNGIIVGSGVSQSNIDALQRRLDELRGTQPPTAVPAAQGVTPTTTTQTAPATTTTTTTTNATPAQEAPSSSGTQSATSSTSNLTSNAMKQWTTALTPQGVRAQMVSPPYAVSSGSNTATATATATGSGNKTVSGNTTGSVNKSASTPKTSGTTASTSGNSPAQQPSYQPLQPTVVGSAFQPKSFDGVLDYRGGLLKGTNIYINPMLANGINRAMSEYASNEANARNAVARVGLIRSQHDPITYQQMQNYMTQGGMSAPEAFMAAMTEHAMANGNYGAVAQTLTNTQNAMDKAALRGATTAAMTGTPYQPFTNQYGMRSMNLVSGYRPNGDGTVSIFTPNGVINGVSMDAASRLLALNGNGDLAQQGMRHLLFNQPQVDTSAAELAGLGQAGSNVDRMREEMREMMNTNAVVSPKPISEKDAVAGVYKATQEHRANNRYANSERKEAEKVNKPVTRAEIF